MPQTDMDMRVPEERSTKEYSYLPVHTGFLPLSVEPERLKCVTS